MKDIDKKYLLLQFWDKVHQKSAAEFQSFFEDIMQKAYPTFQKIRPYGKEGDRGNDGYRPDKGIYYQVYSPRNPNEKEAEAAQKFKNNFRFKRENEWNQLLKQSGTSENTTVVVLSGEPPAKSKKTKPTAKKVK